jgi:putative flippase GtrA
MVGVICFLIDYGTLVLMTELFGINYLISNVIGFTLSVIVNYYLSTKYVFSGRGKFVQFVLLSIAGMGINEFIMFISPINYTITKFFATGVVMVFNFVTRKILLEKQIYERKTE